MSDRGKSDNLTPKQDAFALAFLETGNAAEAYRRAYDVAPDAKDGWIYVEACQLLDNPKVALRLKELQDQAKSLSMFNVAKAAEEYEEARTAAKAAGNPSAMVAATSGKVKLFGLDKPDRLELTGKDGKPLEATLNVAALSSDALREIMAASNEATEADEG